MSGLMVNIPKIFQKSLEKQKGNNLPHRFSFVQINILNLINITVITKPKSSWCAPICLRGTVPAHKADGM
jgi:hypothetical protein